MKDTGKNRDLDAIIVLGAGRSKYCNFLRIREAAKYNNEIPIILTGGRGFLCKNLYQTEAEIMKDYLKEFNIEKKAINLEVEARSTRENFEKSKTLLYLLSDIHKIGVVTNKGHMKRALKYGRSIIPEYELKPLPVRNKWYDFKAHLVEIGCFIYEYTKIPLENLCHKLIKKINFLFLKRKAL